MRIIKGPVQGPPLEFVHYPISHSLAGMLVWAGLVAVNYFVVRRSQKGACGLLTLIAFLFLIQIANAFGSLPPSINVLNWVGQAQWLPVIWEYWVDRHHQYNPVS